MFDGNTWHTYNTSNHSLPSNDVELLVADSLGGVYAVCDVDCSQQVLRFNGTDWQLIDERSVRFFLQQERLR